MLHLLIKFFLFNTLVKKTFAIDIDAKPYQGFVLNSNFGFHTGKLTKHNEMIKEASLCMCKNLCITNKNCTVLSISFKGNKTQCQFSNVSEPIEVTIEDFSEKSLIGIKIEQLMKLQMSDGYLYWVPVGKYSYYEARIKCRTLPGFRLVMVKTQESKLVVEQLLNALSEDLWIDLVKTGNEILWGDGSPLDLGGPLKDILQATGLFNVAFLWTVNGIKDVFINSQYKALCQGEINDF